MLRGMKAARAFARVLRAQRPVRRPWPGRALSRASEAVAEEASKVPPPSRLQLRRLMVVCGVPFIGFGIMDNAVMILAGEQIDSNLGVALGLSTLAAAGLGNLISDVVGLGAGGLIEQVAMRMGLPEPGLSARQLQTRAAKLATHTGNTVGITIGCLIGMFPLLFFDETKANEQKMREKLQIACDEVTQGCCSLLQAESAAVFLVDPGNQWLEARAMSFCREPPPVANEPAANSVFAGANPIALVSSMFVKDVDDIRLPMDVGICGRVAREGLPMNVADCRREPLFSPLFDRFSRKQAERSLLPLEELAQLSFTSDSILVMPVLSSRGEVRAIVRVSNKLERRGGGWQRAAGGFSASDEARLQTLCSHLAVIVENMSPARTEDVSVGEIIRSIEVLMPREAAEPEDGAPARQRPSVPPRTALSGTAALRCTGSIFAAATMGDTKGLQAILLECPDVHRVAKDVKGRTPLHAAAAEGHASTARHLLELGLDPRAPDRKGQSPYELAHRRGHAEVVKLLADFERPHGKA